MGIKRKIPVAKKHELEERSLKSFQFGPAKGIAYKRSGTIKAFVNRCTHMGGPVEFAEGGATLQCRWHDSCFDPDTGCVIKGEAPAGTFLQPIQLLEEDGMLYAVLELPDDPFA